jgi:hypothetical protein
LPPRSWATIATNLFMLGYAWQKGVPLSLEALSAGSS